MGVFLCTSFLTLLRGNAVRDAPRHTPVR
ncbi:DUF1534 domain-containing protein [Pseudomonas savastanoi pv. phaseolicola]|nr:DUF1534 domain-containing protein [Pseudomonas savastanoi pv. phaseolicola]MBN3477790.1 DUF1534 domain-containing protein [Pseudomonas savastanoi pv. phaseolicola]QDW03505.1 DUF1534 domain-containing protein [Pseudomonas sp. KBS0707]